MQFLFIHGINDIVINKEFSKCFWYIKLHLDRDLTDFKRNVDKQSYKITELFVYFWLRKEITSLV